VRINALKAKGNRSTKICRAATETMSMRAIQISVVAAALVLGSCTVSTNSRVAEDSAIWGRADCQRGEGNPELQAEFENAKATCLARGETAAAVAGSAGDNPCMNEQGYILRTRAEHAAACQGMQEQKGKPASMTKKPASKSKSPKPTSTPESTSPASAKQ
jgi:hypothetical protein